MGSRFLLTKPSRERMQAFLDEQRSGIHSYAQTGATRGEPPAGFTADRYSVRLGSGAEAFARGVEAVRGWKMFDLGWLEVWPPDAPIEAGATVAIVVRHYGFWSLNACRIVYVADRAAGIHPEYGFGYGTLEQHSEIGEERFTVEMRPADGSVWYHIYALSRPRGPARALYPLARRLQKRFGRDSMEAMRRAVAVPSAVTW